MGANSKSSGRTASIIVSVCMLFGSFSPVFAADESVNSANALQEIVVTAQRRQESLDKVPISISAYTQQALDDLHVESFSDLAAVVPGLYLPPTQNSGSQSNTQIYIRGVVSVNNAPTTGIYIDETPIIVRQMNAAGYSGTPTPDLFDLNRVEVLRGPQGTLFGASAMGGAIRYVTPQPDLKTASGYSRAELSLTDRGAPSEAVGLAYGAPIIPGEAAFRVSGWAHWDGGFIDLEDPYTGQIVRNNINSARALVFRPAITVAPIEGLTVTAAAFYQNHQSSAPPEVWLSDLPRQGPYLTGFGFVQRQPVQDDLGVYSLNIRYDLGVVSLVSDTSYMNRSYNDFDDYTNILTDIFGAGVANPALSSFGAYDENRVWTQAWQEDLRLSSNDSGSRVSWLAGVYFRRAVDKLTQYISDLSPIAAVFGLTEDQFLGPEFALNGYNYSGYANFTTVTQQAAFYGDVTVQPLLRLLPRLRADLGVRIEDARVLGQREFTAGPLQGGGNSLTASTLPDDIEHPVTPRFALTYQYTDTAMAYASASRGYRQGGGNSANVTDNPQCVQSANQLGLSSVPVNFKSDHLWNYELGAKGAFFNQRLTIEGSVYYIDWSDIQTNIGLASCFLSFTANRGKAISQGFDLQWAAILAEGLKFAGAVGYTDAYYPNASYGTAQAPNSPPIYHVAGEKLQIVPWQGSANLEYSHGTDALWSNSRGYVRAEYRWQSADPSRPLADTGVDPLLGPNLSEGYQVLNLRIGLLHQGLDLSVYVENLADTNPRLGFVNQGFGDTFFNALAIRPLTVGVQALYRFQ